MDAQPAGVLGREAGRQVGGRADIDPSQQLLHVRGDDPLRRELLRQHLSVEQRDGEQVGQRVVGLLLGADLLLPALLAAADDVVGDLERLQLDPLDLRRVECVRLAQCEQCLERRLGVNLGVVALEERAADALEVLVLPGDLEGPGDRLDEALVPLEHLGRAGDAAGGEEGRLDGAEGRERKREPFPLRERARPGHAQRVQRRARDRDRVRRLRLAETQRLRRPGRGGIGALRGVVEALRPHRRFVREPALNLVGDRERRQQLPSGRLRVLGGREHGCEVVTRVAGLTGREVGVVEVEVAHQRAVQERRAIRGGGAAADQRAERPAAELLHLRANRVNGRRAERAECAAERVQHADLQLASRRVREVVPAAGNDEARQPCDRGHRERLPLRRISASTTASLCSTSRAE